MLRFWYCDLRHSIADHGITAGQGALYQKYFSGEYIPARHKTLTQGVAVFAAGDRGGLAALWEENSP